MNKRCVAALAVLAVSACGKSGGQGAIGTMASLATEPKGAISTDGQEAVVTSKGGTDWNAVAKGAPQVSGLTGKVNPSKISTAGISQPLEGFSSQKPTGFRVAYAPTKKYERFRTAFMQEQVFENVAKMLNGTLKMPRIVNIQMVECGTVNAFYDPNNSRIIMCYELMDYFTQMFQPVSKSNDELGNAILGATFFAFFHELGHGLIHQLDLPATGREEDSVDQMATLVLMEGGDQGVAAAMAGARWFALQSEANKKAGVSMPFWDEHSLEGQRFYNIACLIFGSNPEKYSPMIENGYLPKARAVRCPDEFKKISHAWERLLGPYIINDGQAVATADDTPATPTPNTAGSPGGPMAPKPLPGGDTNAKPSGDNPMAPKPLPGGGDTTAGQTPAAPPSGPTCDSVASHALDVISKAALAQAQAAGPDAVKATQEQLQNNGPLVVQQIVQECQEKKWTPQVLQCLTGAADLNQLQACGV